MFREKNTADQIWEAMEFKDLQDEVVGPTMTGNGECSFYCTPGCRTDPVSCRTNAYCPSPGKKK